jgi:AcrR family transcriptional regulator
VEPTTEYQKREERLLGLGRQLLVEQGFVGLQMESIASRSSFSRAIVYKHFRSKEELASKIVLHSAQLRFAAIDKAYQFSGNTRERVLALLLAEEQFSIQNPDRYPSELILRISGLLSGAQPVISTSLNELDLEIASRFVAVVEEAIGRGDLPPGCNANETLRSIMAICIGLQVLKLLRRNEFSADLKTLTTSSIHLLLDGLQWQPLGKDWPYEASTRRILAFLNN